MPTEVIIPHSQCALDLPIIYLLQLSGTRPVLTLWRALNIKSLPVGASVKFILFKIDKTDAADAVKLLQAEHSIAAFDMELPTLESLTISAPSLRHHCMKCVPTLR